MHKNTGPARRKDDAQPSGQLHWEPEAESGDVIRISKQHALINAAQSLLQTMGTPAAVVAMPGTPTRWVGVGELDAIRELLPVLSDKARADTWEGEAARLRSVLVEVRHALQFASDSVGGGINDTLWMMHGQETVFDFIDAALAAGADGSSRRAKEEGSET